MQVLNIVWSTDDVEGGNLFLYRCAIPDLLFSLARIQKQIPQNKSRLQLHPGSNLN